MHEGNCDCVRIPQLQGRLVVGGSIAHAIMMIYDQPGHPRNFEKTFTLVEDENGKMKCVLLQKGYFEKAFESALAMALIKK
jgi:hypothetical protein